MRITNGICPLCLHNFIDGILTLNAENTNYAYQVPSFHKCEICLLSFPKESQFQRHMKDHERNDKVGFSKGMSGMRTLKLGYTVPVNMQNENFSHNLDS